jgi:rhodanese-related sulfurtransferase
MSMPSVDPSGVPADAVLLDVREQPEWDAGHAPSALHIPMSQLVGRVEEVPDGDVYVVCRSGARSAQVSHWLAAQGRSAANVDGGMEVWAERGLPMASSTGDPPRVI